MKIKVRCEDCGRDLGTQVVQGVQEVVIDVHGCKCSGRGYTAGFERGLKEAREFGREVKEQQVTDDTGRI